MHDVLDLIFWGVAAAYVMHILDETLMNGGFVALVQKHWWPAYNDRKFFWFNTGYMVILIASILLYENLGGHWVVLPLIWVFERAAHGITFHLWWTVRYREYSPGLVTSILFWILAYFTIRDAIRPGSIIPAGAEWGAGLGVLCGILIAFGPAVLMPHLARRGLHLVHPAGSPTPMPRATIGLPADKVY
jgi:Protein of unknown function with HXXEE motif